MNDNKELELLKYPIGHFKSPENINLDTVKNWIKEIEELPVQLKGVVEKLSEQQLDTPYREGGWTIRQIVHHLGDSHLNSYIRLKLALTEERPTIKPYDQDLWAKLPDYMLFPVKDSLTFIEVLHKRWVILLKTLDKDQIERTFFHPESGVVVLKKNIGIYAWHGRHHLAQIKALIQREGW
jgi:hypothetical protein